MSCDICDWSPKICLRGDGYDKGAVEKHAKTQHFTEQEILSYEKINNEEDQSSSRGSSCPSSVDGVIGGIETVDLDGINEKLNDVTLVRDRKNTEYHYCDICETPFSTKQFLDQHKQNKHDYKNTSLNLNVDENSDKTPENTKIKYQHVRTSKILKISRIRTSKTKDRENKSNIKLESGWKNEMEKFFSFENNEN